MTLDNDGISENHSEGLRKIPRESSLWWFAGGLRFECLGCGRCCRGESGGIFLRPKEEFRIAGLLGLDPTAFRRKYETGRWRFPSIKERPDGACVMLSPRNRCEIYPCRPLACRTWPWWPEVLRTPQRWNDAAGHCPGMNSGKLWSGRQILEILNAHMSYLHQLGCEWRREAGTWKQVSGSSSPRSTGSSSF
ncbi:MAG: YkgJ family cysteine cluster protein [Pyramidobacter sp.]|jgi:Fe-S-cluster containining protein